MNKLVMTGLEMMAVPFSKSNGVIGIYSNVFGGNAKALFLELYKQDYKVVWLSPTLKTHHQVLDEGYSSYYEGDIRNIFKFVNTTMWISTHGLARYRFMTKFKRLIGKKIRIVDIWHGLTGKKFGNRVDYLNMCDAICTNSVSFKEKYVNVGVPENKIHVTGQLAMDELVNTKYKIIKPTLLYAPTWGYDDIGISDFKYLDDKCNKLNCQFVIRLHINYSKSVCDEITRKVSMLKNVKVENQIDNPSMTNAMLKSNVLITDYSTISQQYLALKRPIVYFDRGKPNSGVFLSDEDRVGEFYVKTEYELADILEKALKTTKLNEGRKILIDKIHSNTLDGKSTLRCLQVVQQLL